MIFCLIPYQNNCEKCAGVCAGGCGLIWNKKEHFDTFLPFFFYGNCNQNVLEFPILPIISY